MNRIIQSSLVFYGLTSSILTATILGLTSQSANAQTAPCYAQFQGQTLFVLNGALDACARTIRAAAGGAQYGVGTWGGNTLNVDANGNTYINSGDGQWQYIGAVRNPNGTVGSLQDRCMAGDTQACNQWQRQTEGAIEQMDQLYPSGWSQ